MTFSFLMNPISFSKWTIGYNETLGITLTNEKSVQEFINDSDPIQFLTDSTSIRFNDGDTLYREHTSTTPEIVTCLQDLRVSNLTFTAVFKNERMKVEPTIRFRSIVVPVAGLISGKPIRKPMAALTHSAALSDYSHFLLFHVHF